MIDTINFEVHDLKLHEGLTVFLKGKSRNSGKTIKQKHGGSDDFTIDQQLHHKTFIHYLDTGNIVDVAHFDNLKSSHYSIAFQIDYVRNFIRFNLSVPKYAYGTNIVQYMPNPTHPKFNFYRMQDLRNSLDASYDWLMQFFKRFFSSEFGEISIYKSHLFISRVDLCYNQVFNTKQEAMAYFKEMKRVKKKFSRDASNYSRSWETSLMYKTDRYSFKCYHKGSEYKVKDRKEHKKLNDAAGKKLFDTEYLQGFADRILRYEMTIRNSYMSYEYMHKVFRKDCPVWASCMAIYKEFRNKQGKPDFLDWKRSLEVFQRKELAYVLNFIYKSKKFSLSDKYTGPDGWNDYTNLAELQNIGRKKPRFEPFAHFSKDLFNALGVKFLEILGEFQLELKLDKNQLLRNLERHNQQATEQLQAAKAHNITFTAKEKKTARKISLSKISVALELLAIHNFSEIQKMDIYSRQTWYNIRQDLALLGVSEKSLLQLNINPTFDHKAYISELQFNTSKFINLSFIV